MNSTQLQAAWFGAPANKSASKFPIDVPADSNFFEEAMKIAVSKAEKTFKGHLQNLSYVDPDYGQGDLKITSLNVKGVYLQGFKVKAQFPIFFDTKKMYFSKAIAFKDPGLDFSWNTIWEVESFGQGKFHYVGQEGTDADFKDMVLDHLERFYDLTEKDNKLKLRKVKRINPRLPVIYDGALVYANYEFDMLPHFIEGLPQSVSSQLPVPSGQAGQGILDSEKLEEAIDRIDDILTDYEEEIWVLENSELGQAHSALEDYKHTMEKALSKMR